MCKSKSTSQRGHTASFESSIHSFDHIPSNTVLQRLRFKSLAEEHPERTTESIAQGYHCQSQPNAGDDDNDADEIPY